MAESTTEIGEKFKGLPMRELISAPLISVCEAQQQLAMTAYNYYKKIGFEDSGDNVGKPRLLEFELERPVQTPDGIDASKIKVQAPFIGLVPAPSLLIDTVNIDFQMEVTDSSTSKSTLDSSFSTEASSKWFGTSVSIQGKVTTSRENTRATNQTAKYQVSVLASQQKPTEGLSKLMDIMATCIEPLDSKKNPS